MKIRKTVGIDLGTTNSVIALMDPTDSALLAGTDGQGRKILPSVVALQEGQNRIVAGWNAREWRDARTRVSSVKRHMGLERTFPLGGENLTPVEVSARILSHCRDCLGATLNDSRYLLDSAIVTMPAYFNHNQIEDTRKAGELAGFEVVELLHEPTAAAIYYSWVGNHGDATYLVYDLGGGTFDVSIIRRRLGDYEVLSVSGDPFLGGDDFDRLLATHLREQVERSHPRRINFDLQSEDGRANFAGLVAVAERMKMTLSDEPSASTYEEKVATDVNGEAVHLHATVSRDTFQGLIRDKVHRTIDCCREALGRAKEKCGLSLSDVDHVILVGGSSRIPYVRECIRSAFCNESLPEHVRDTRPLLHEPDLCVAYGAALRAATHGTRYVFSVFRHEEAPSGLLPDLEMELGESDAGRELELHWTSAVNVTEKNYTLTGCVRGPGAAEVCYGGTVRVCCYTTGLTEEMYLDREGTFSLEMDLQPDADNAMELAVCDNLGRELVRIPACVRHRTPGKEGAEERATLGHGVLPTQLITKPLSIEVLNRGRQRFKQIVAPVGAALPGTFRCTCRTVDQKGKIVVPIFEENRVIKQMEIRDLDPKLPVGSPVDVEFKIDVKHNIDVRVLVRQANRSESITLAGPPPPHAPTRGEVEKVRMEIEELLEEFTGGARSRYRARLGQLLQDLNEARYYEDEPKAIQRFAELRDLFDEMERERSQAIEPPWPRFAQLAQHTRALADEVSRLTGKDKGEMLEYVRSQERTADRAYQERNQALYRECWLNLERYAWSLEDLRRAATRKSEYDETPAPGEITEEEARDEVERFRRYLSDVWKRARSKGRKDLDAKLAQVAKQSQGVSQLVKDDPSGAIREARRWGAEVNKIEVLLRENRPLPEGDDEKSGLLEGTL